MFDLYLGLVVVTGLSLFAFWSVAMWARRLSSLQRTVLAGGIVGTMLLYGSFVWQDLSLAMWLPFSNLIVLGNWFPVFLAALAGVVVVIKLPTYRRVIMAGSLFAISIYAALWPVLGATPHCADHASRYGDCVQTTEFTCSAASAATLLRAHGIPATEQEMAQLCLTRRGTSWQGLYRGLKLKTAGTRWDVQFVRCSADEVHTYSDRPMIAEVGLAAGARVDATFRSEYGWVAGMRHSVIVSGFTNHNRASIIDPSPDICREDWDADMLRLLWRGSALRLVER